MNIYRRLLQALKPYWKHLVVSSSSAAFYALLTGVTVWMAGPLLTTLFQISPESSVTSVMNPGAVMLCRVEPPRNLATISKRS